MKTCTHRKGNGKATDSEIARHRPGYECPVCGCTLGTDGYWYIESEQAPGYPFAGRAALKGE